MRINQYIARTTGVSRRKADELISSGLVEIDGKAASVGQRVKESETVTVKGRAVALTDYLYLVMNKPPGYVCSRSRQGKSPTIYNLLPPKYHHLKPVGRLDKDSRGLLLLTNDGPLAQKLTHPSYQKTKVYNVVLGKPLSKNDRETIKNGISINGEYISRLRLTKIENWKLRSPALARIVRGETGNCSWRIAMNMGKNRQIRRTFAALSYEVTDLQRVQFGDLKLDGLAEGEHKEINIEKAGVRKVNM